MRSLPQGYTADAADDYIFLSIFPNLQYPFIMPPLPTVSPFHHLALLISNRFNQPSPTVSPNIQPQLFVRILLLTYHTRTVSSSIPTNSIPNIVWLSSPNEESRLFHNFLFSGLDSHRFLFYCCCFDLPQHFISRRFFPSIRVFHRPVFSFCSNQ